MIVTRLREPLAGFEIFEINSVLTETRILVLQPKEPGTSHLWANSSPRLKIASI